MIEKIKNWFFYRQLKETGQIKQSIPQGLNLGARILILFDGTDENSCKDVVLFKKRLMEEASKNVSILAFIDNEISEDSPDFRVFNRKNLKWYGVPFGEQVEEFLKEKCDILLVLCHKMLPQFEYIIALSTSSFIIGPDIRRSEKYFDLIIESHPNGKLSDLITKILEVTERLALKP
jgi:hypothetical protein